MQVATIKTIFEGSSNHYLQLVQLKSDGKYTLVELYKGEHREKQIGIKTLVKMIRYQNSQGGPIPVLFKIEGLPHFSKL